MEIVLIFVIVVVIYLFYNLFEIFRPRSDTVLGLSVFGSTMMCLRDYNQILSVFEKIITTHKTETRKLMILGQPTHFVTQNPKNIQHILKDNFENYGKGCLNFNSQKEINYMYIVF